MYIIRPNHMVPRTTNSSSEILATQVGANLEFVKEAIYLFCNDLIDALGNDGPYPTEYPDKGIENIYEITSPEELIEFVEYREKNVLFRHNDGTLRLFGAIIHDEEIPINDYIIANWEQFTGIIVIDTTENWGIDEKVQAFLEEKFGAMAFW